MKISILGCGWLGFPAGRKLLEAGNGVRGAVRTEKRMEAIEDAGIEPFLIHIAPEGITCEPGNDFWDTDLLLLNIPPGRSKGDVLSRHPSEIRVVMEKVEKAGIPWVIFASSTSVYSKFGGLKTEEDTDLENTSSDSGKALLLCENLLREADFDTTIIRFGGLYGYDRHPGRYLAGKKDLKEANKPVNLIHQDDCVRIIDDIVRKNMRNETFNAVSDGHPPRRQFYQTVADRIGITPPVFEEDSESDYRVVSNRKLKNRLHFTFKYPNPMDHTP